ncbi:MAG: nucleotidyltransferase domain-containing protein [Candidatus Asgardarchaeum sp.]
MDKIKYYYLSHNEKKEVKRRLKGDLQKRDDIIFAVLHGSFIESEYFRDIDIAIYVKPCAKEYLFKEYVIDLSLSLSKKIGIPVDIQVLNEAPLMFIYEVLNRGELIVCNDELFFERYSMTIETEVWDFLYLLKIVEKL